MVKVHNGSAMHKTACVAQVARKAGHGPLNGSKNLCHERVEIGNTATERAAQVEKAYHARDREFIF